MKHLIFFIWAIIITILWIVIMIPSFIVKTLWDFNSKNYKFRYNPYRVDKSEIHNAVSPYSNNNQDDYKNCDHNYRTYFHYVWNIKSRNNEI